MGIFSKIKDKGELVAVFDISSSSVGGALFLMQSGVSSGIPKILISIREQIDLEDTFNIDSFLSSTVKSLGIVASGLYKAGIGAPKRIFCVLSSPWYVSQTRVISFERNTPFTFTAKFADSLVQKEINFFEEENLAKYGNTISSLRLIELKNIKTILNGYETSKPLDQKAKKLEMTIFISMSPESVLKKIEETVAHYFYFEEIKFSSFAMASFITVRDLYANKDNFLLVDIGGEVTDISMVKKNILHGSISYPRGSNFIMRAVASSLRISLPEAQSQVSLFVNGHASHVATKKLEKVFDKLKTDWLGKLEESLANLSNDISIPSTIYVSTDKELADFFCKIIETEQLNQYTLADSKFKVISLNTEIFHGMVAFDVDTTRDPGLIIDSIYLNRFF